MIKKICQVSDFTAVLSLETCENYISVKIDTFLLVKFFPLKTAYLSLLHLLV